MNASEVMTLLETNRNPRGVEIWEKMGAETGGLKSFGIGLTVLRKLGKQVGRNHELAMELWGSDHYDAKVLGLLIDDPKKLTREQVEVQVEELGMGMLAHVFSSCDAPLSKAPFVFELACDWIEHSDSMRRRCGWGLVYELSKNYRKPELTDEFFLRCIQKIRERFREERPSTLLAMGAALMGIGKRSRKLNAAALVLAQEMGPIDFSEDGRKCDPFDVVKHLTSDYLKKKLRLS